MTVYYAAKYLIVGFGMMSTERTPRVENRRAYIGVYSNYL